MQPEILVRGIQANDFRDERLTIRGLFQHNHNWDRYAWTHRDGLWGVEEREAEKLVSCHCKDRGYKLYLCPSCSDDHLVTFGCNSRLCSGCGKPHADRWATDLRRTILPAPHRHLTGTSPSPSPRNSDP